MDTPKSVYNIGIDVGFGDVKIASNCHNGSGKPATKILKFPTALAPLRKNNLKALENAVNSYSLNNKDYIVGEEALLSQRVIPIRDISCLLDFIPLFLFRSLEELISGYRKTYDEMIQAEKYLAIGLPLGFYSDNKETVKERVKSFQISDCNVTFESVSVHAQGQGILFDCLNAKLKDKTFLIVDIGFNTVDILAVDKGKSRKDWSTMIVGAGLCQICDELRTDISQKTNGLEYSQQEIKEALSKKYITHYGERIDISEAVHYSTADYTDFLFREINTRTSGFLKKCEKLIVAGGGSYYIQDELIRRFSEDFIHIPPQPEFSNARGYLKLLLHG